MTLYRKTALVNSEVFTEDGLMDTLEGRMSYKAGDYKLGPGAGGEYWPVKKDIFEATYVVAEQAEAEHAT